MELRQLKQMTSFASASFCFLELDEYRIKLD